MSNKSDFTYNMFMEATKHLDNPNSQPLKMDFIEETEPQGVAEKNVILVSRISSERKAFYTKQEAKEFAQKIYDAPLKWFRNKQGEVFAKDEQGSTQFKLIFTEKQLPEGGQW